MTNYYSPIGFLKIHNTSLDTFRLVDVIKSDRGDQVIEPHEYLYRTLTQDTSLNYVLPLQEYNFEAPKELVRSTLYGGSSEISQDELLYRTNSLVPQYTSHSEVSQESAILLDKVIGVNLHSNIYLILSPGEDKVEVFQKSTNPSGDPYGLNDSSVTSEVVDPIEGDLVGDSGKLRSIVLGISLPTIWNYRDDLVDTALRPIRKVVVNEISGDLSLLASETFTSDLSIETQLEEVIGGLRVRSRVIKDPAPRPLETIVVDQSTTSRDVPPLIV